jgi:hypothetical protein
MVPYPVTAYKQMSANREDGIVTVHCMSTKDYLKFYNDNKYWNLDLKEDFMGQTRTLWADNTSKYVGNIFSLSS